MLLVWHSDGYNCVVIQGGPEVTICWNLKCDSIGNMIMPDYQLKSYIIGWYFWATRYKAYGHRVV